MIPSPLSSTYSIRSSSPSVREQRPSPWRHNRREGHRGGRAFSSSRSTSAASPYSFSSSTPEKASSTHSRQKSRVERIRNRKNPSRHSFASSWR